MDDKKIEFGSLVTQNTTYQEPKRQKSRNLRKLLENRRFVIALCVVLLTSVAFGVLLGVYLANNKQNRELYDSQRIVIIIDGEEAEYSYDQLAALSPVVEFDAVLKTSAMNTAVEKTYQGIRVDSLLVALGFDTADLAGIVFTASDGKTLYYSKTTIESGKVYIAHKVDGEPFNKGILANGYLQAAEDGGPFVVIDAGYAFSDSRVKMLVKIQVERRI